MPSPADQMLQKPTVTAAQRETIHDLRNLFGIVASATHILERDPEPSRRTVMLEAIEGAAIRGGALTTTLLASAPRTGGGKTIDVGSRLADLAPMIGAIAGTRLELDFQVFCPNAQARIDAEGFDAAILELVANAKAAGASRIILRSHKVGARLWILVSDNGKGMSAQCLAGARQGGNSGHARGNGLCRIHRLAREAHGHLLIRSRPLAGTSIALILPTVLSIAVDEPTAPQRSDTPHKETIHEEDRQPIAA